MCSYIHILELLHLMQLGLGSPDANMSAVWTMLAEWWQDNPAGQRYSHLKICSWCNQDDPHGSMPKLKGRAIEVRSLVPALASVWARVMETTKPEPEAVPEGVKILPSWMMFWMPIQMLMCSQGMIAMILGMHHGRMQGFRYARIQSALADHYNQELDYFLFAVTMKTH